jgi:hypothetical protein
MSGNAGQLVAMVDQARACEKLLALAAILGFAVDQAKHVTIHDGSLEPEMTALIDDLGSAMERLIASIVVLRAKLELT